MLVSTETGTAVMYQGSRLIDQAVGYELCVFTLKQLIKTQ